jgi:hypothetical protein
LFKGAIAGLLAALAVHTLVLILIAKVTGSFLTAKGHAFVAVLL